ncbi:MULTISPECIES: ureidoglycolate lyase [Pseudomonas]|uniref:ureidoglycolate lyase n=1 Tax=Pseudomonas TaxID=286 RepID=UPI0009FF447C
MSRSDKPFLIVVTSAGDTPGPDPIRTFLTNEEQGISCHQGVLHYSMRALVDIEDFPIVDQSGTANRQPATGRHQVHIPLGYTDSFSQ